MSVNVCIQKILLLTRQILNCEVQNSYLKTIIFKLHRKVELGVKTINYLNYYYIKETEKFNSKQTSNTLIGFLASLDSIYLYINPVEDSKGGFLNQLLGLSEDNVKREFYFLLQSLDESIIEVQNILERALSTTFNELPDLGTLSPLPPTETLPLSPTSPLNESFSNISEAAQKSKTEPTKPIPNQQNLAQQSIDSALDIKTDQNVSTSEPVNLSNDGQKIQDKPAEATSEITQAMNELNISKPVESQEKEAITGQKLDHENNTITSNPEEQALNNSDVKEHPINKENTDNIQPAPINQNPAPTPIENNINSPIKTDEPNSASEQHIPIATGENNGIQNSEDSQSTITAPLQSVSESTAPVQVPKVESSAIEPQAPNQISNNNESITNISTSPSIEKRENSQIPCGDLGQSGSQPNQNNIPASNEPNTAKNSESVPASVQPQVYAQNDITPSNITPVQQQPTLNNQIQQPCNQDNSISSNASPVQQQAAFNNQTQQPCSPNPQQFSHPGSPIHISSPAQPIHPGSPHHISSPTQPTYPVSPNQQPYPCSPTQPIYPGSPNHIASPTQPIIPSSPSHFSAGPPNSLYSNQNQPPPLPHRPSPLPSPEQHFVPPPASLFPQVNHYQNNNSYAPPFGSTSPVQQHFNPGYGGSPYQSPPQPQFRPNQPYHHGHTHSAQLPNFNDSLAFLPINQYIRPNSPGYINPPQFGGYQQPPPQSQFPQMMMPSPDQYIQSRSGPQSNSNNDRRNMPLP